MFAFRKISSLPSQTNHKVKGKIMSVTINKDVLQGKWKQARGKVKQQWGRLTDNELDQISGYYDELAGLIQERYGYSREKAQQELDAFIERWDRESR
jgi:uncharacterized protein YjbJ (UPF0337 family)